MRADDLRCRSSSQDVAALRQKRVRRSGPPRTQAMARRPGTSIRCNSSPSRPIRMKASSKDATHTAASRSRQMPSGALMFPNQRRKLKPPSASMSYSARHSPSISATTSRLLSAETAMPLGNRPAGVPAGSFEIAPPSSSLFSLIRVIFAVGYRRKRGIEHVSYTWLLGKEGSERALDRFGDSMMQRVEKWRIGRADVEYDHLGRLSRTGIVADHRHVRRLSHCLPA